MRLLRISLFGLALIALASPLPAHGQVRGPFEVKRGVVEMKVEGMGDGTQTLYFDDFGAKQALHTRTSLTLFGQTATSTSVRIYAEGFLTEHGDTRDKYAWRSRAAQRQLHFPTGDNCTSPS